LKFRKYDMVLGVDWLKIYSPVLYDFRNYHSKKKGE
jgi:hypothetical protein